MPNISKTEGCIRLEDIDVNRLRLTTVSSPVLIENWRWNLSVRRVYSNEMQRYSHLEVLVQCDAIEANAALSNCEVELSVRSKETFRRCPSRPLSVNLLTNTSSGKANGFISKSLMEMDNVFYSSKDITIEAKITVEKEFTGIQFKIPSFFRTPLYDFTTTEQNIRDVALVFDGRPLYVGKEYLSTLSPVFYTMFFKGFREQGMSEIPLKDVDFDEFNELLQVIYPSRKKITAENVEYLLRLSVRFALQILQSECTQFLCSVDCREIPLEKKILWADSYNIATLQEFCIDSITTTELKATLMSKEEYAEFSEKTKIAIAGKVVKDDLKYFH